MNEHDFGPNGHSPSTDGVYTIDHCRSDCGNLVTDEVYTIDLIREAIKKVV